VGSVGSLVGFARRDWFYGREPGAILFRAAPGSGTGLVDRQRESAGSSSAGRMDRSPLAPTSCNGPICLFRSKSKSRIGWASIGF